VSRLVLIIALAASTSACNLVRGPRRDHECRSTLRSIMVAEFAFHSVQRRYTVHPHELGFAPPPGNRYAYVFDRTGDVTRRDEKPSPPPEASVGYGPDTEKRRLTVEDLVPKLPPEVRAMLGLEGTCPDCQLTVACVGNLDDDPDLDVWTISTKDRPGANRGTPLRVTTDLDGR
jgi:type IV pilus assembly protein PilA